MGNTFRYGSRSRKHPVFDDFDSDDVWCGEEDDNEFMKDKRKRERRRIKELERDFKQKGFHPRKVAK